MKIQPPQMPREIDPADLGVHVLVDHESPTVDIVAVHGLGATPSRSWCKIPKIPAQDLDFDNLTNTSVDPINWLSHPEMLPKKVPFARIMTFNYDGNWYGDNAVKIRLDHVANDLRRDVERERRGCSSRPLIFIGHCFGGLIIEKALINPEMSGILNVTMGVVLLGTPHRGTDNITSKELVQRIMATSTTAEPASLAALQADNEMVFDAVQTFLRTAHKRNVQIHCFFEQRSSKVSKMFEGDESKEFIVDEKSAALDGCESYGLPLDHYQLNKFSSSLDNNWRKIAGVITDLCNDACHAVAGRMDGTSQTSIQRQYEAPDEAAFQRSLRFLAYPEMHYRRNDARRAHPNTCEWITGHQCYTSWLKEGAGILWIMGKPGSGKSTLMEFLLRNHEKQASSQNSVQISFFLYDRGTNLQKSRLGMYRSLLHQLLSHSTPDVGGAFQHTFEHKCRTQGEPGKDWDWHMNELHQFFIDAVQNIARTRSVNIFVDALDEADDDAGRQIVAEFHELNDNLSRENLQSTICFSSRHFPIITDNHKWEIVLEKENSEDITTYVHDELHHGLHNADSQDLIYWESTIIEKSENLFQWAALVVRMVIRSYHDGLIPKVIEDMLLDVPHGLDGIYKHILEKIMKRDGHLQTLRLMRWMCLAQRPLNVGHLILAMNIPDTGTFDTEFEDLDLPTPQTMLKRIGSLSGGLIKYVEQDPLHLTYCLFIHASVNDFLLRAGGLEFLDTTYDSEHTAIALGHHQLSVICANYIGMIRMDGSYIDSRSKYLHSENTADRNFMEYAVKNWFHHARSAEVAGVPQHYLLKFMHRRPNAIKNWCILFEAIHSFGETKKRFGPNPTMLHIACSEDILGVVNDLLTTSDQLHLMDDDGDQALHYAARCGHTRIVKVLLDAGASIKKENKLGFTAISQAATRGHLEVVKMLLREDGNEKQVNYSGTSSYRAIAKTRIARLGRFLTHKTEIPNDNGLLAATNKGRFQPPDSQSHHTAFYRIKSILQSKNRYYGKALVAAAGEGDQPIVQLFLDRKVDVNKNRGRYRVKSLYGHTAAIHDSGSALDAAACNGHFKVVQLLLDYGADVNARGWNYGTALQVAALRYRQSIVQLLLDNGADINAQGGQYGAALGVAAYQNYQHVTQMILNRKAESDQSLNIIPMIVYRDDDYDLRSFLDKDAHVVAHDWVSVSALQKSERQMYHGLMKLYVEHVADINSGNVQVSSNALDGAILARSWPIIQLLLANGASSKAALHSAVECGDIEVFSFIFERFGAAVDSMSSCHPYKCTPLMLAAVRRRVEIVEFLLKHGADASIFGAFGEPIVVHLRKEKASMQLKDEWDIEDMNRLSLVIELIENHQRAQLADVERHSTSTSMAQPPSD